MEEEMTDVTPAENETAADSSTEEETTEVDSTSAEEEQEEPVDESGVPLKNRIAENERKLRKALSEIEEPTKVDESPLKPEAEAERIVRNIAREEYSKAVQPLIARQFMVDNPDAVELVDDILRVQKEHPELRDFSKLPLAYKIAKAEAQDRLLIEAEERGRVAAQNKQNQATQAATQGTGKTSTPPSTIDEKIASASSLEELAKLEKAILGN